jgi:hypothetical protein
MSEETRRPDEHDQRTDHVVDDDETEVVPHSEDLEEQLPWCVGFFA